MQRGSIEARLLAVIFFISSTLLIPSSAFCEGGGGGAFNGGGGGKGVVCRDEATGRTTVELLDLWEARKIHQLELLPAKGTVKEMLYSALRALSHSVHNDDAIIDVYEGATKTHAYRGADAVFFSLLQNAGQFLLPDSGPRNVVIRRMRDVRLADSNDALEIATPRNCKIEQLVLYRDYSTAKGEIVIDQDLFDLLSPQGQAALLAHEGLYKFLRDSAGETNSLRVRRTIGLAFSGKEMKALNKKHLPKQYYECTSKRADGNEVPWDRGDSRVFVVPEIRLSRDPNFRGLIFQAATIGGLVAIDAAPVLLDPEGGTVSYEDFSDLSKLVSAYGGYPVLVQTRGSYSPRFRPGFAWTQPVPADIWRFRLEPSPRSFSLKE